jgi:hypothetical protein
MSQIEQIVKQIQSEFRLDTDGKAFVSIRGAARLAKISQGGLSDSLKSGVQQKPTQLAEYLDGRGFDYVQQASWSDNGIPDLALAGILSYYAYEAQPRYRTEQAKLCCYAFEAIGIRSWVQNCFDWKKSEIKALPALTQENRLRAVELGTKLLEFRHDERLLMTLQAEVKNLLVAESREPSEPKLMSATEWLGTIGYRPPSNKENWLGRKIAEAWRSQRKSEPTTAPKFVGTNHETQIKVYPEDFLPAIIEVTEDYCQVKLTED